MHGLNRLYLLGGILGGMMVGLAAGHFITKSSRNYRDEHLRALESQSEATLEMTLKLAETLLSEDPRSKPAAFALLVEYLPAVINNADHWRSERNTFGGYDHRTRAPLIRAELESRAPEWNAVLKASPSIGRRRIILPAAAWGN